MHARQQILNAAIVALKAGVPSVQDRVLEDDGLELPEDKLPAVVVRATDEVVEHGAQVKERRLRLEIAAGAMAKTGLQAVLNELAAYIEATLDGGLTVSGKALNLRHTAVASDVAANAARKAGSVLFAYELIYFTHPGAPGTIL